MGAPQRSSRRGKGGSESVCSVTGAVVSQRRRKNRGDSVPCCLTNASGMRPKAGVPCARTCSSGHTVFRFPRTIYLYVALQDPADSSPAPIIVSPNNSSPPREQSRSRIDMCRMRTCRRVELRCVCVGRVVRPGSNCLVNPDRARYFLAPAKQRSKKDVPLNLRVL